MLVTCTTGLDMCRSAELVLSLSNHLHTYFTSESDQSGRACWPTGYLKLYVGGMRDSSTTLPQLSVTRAVIVDTCPLNML